MANKPKSITPDEINRLKNQYYDAVQARNEEIRRLWATGEYTMTQLSKIYQIDLGLVSKIISGQR